MNCTASIFLCEQFLLFVESRALRGLSLTMAEMSQKFDELLRVQGHPVFSGYKDYLKNKAVAHAVRELSVYRKLIEVEEATALARART